MALNLYDLHPDPENAPDYDLHHDTVPELVWKKYKDDPKELKKREKALAKDLHIAFDYAKRILKGPFPAGEAVIAKHSNYAYYYAKEVLKGPFPAGEAAIAKDPQFSYEYAKTILGLPEAEAKVWRNKLKEGLLAELLALYEGR